VIMRVFLFEKLKNYNKFMMRNKLGFCCNPSFLKTVHMMVTTICD
jgi:hypothetical protein